MQSVQPLTEMSTGNLPGVRGQSPCKADLTAKCEPTVWKMWEPRYQTNPVGLHGFTFTIQSASKFHALHNH
jgi:hypothetical protein